MGRQVDKKAILDVLAVLAPRAAADPKQWRALARRTTWELHTMTLQAARLAMVEVVEHRLGCPRAGDK